ncbi:MAG: hypothetical protein WD767_05665 [Alphaproteobacteria bacterium]
MLTTLRGLVLAAIIGFAATSAALAAEETITIGEWRTEPAKSLVCSGEAGNIIVDIATRANTFYLSGGQKGSPEYDAYWTALEKALQERHCFVTEKMRHLPDAIVYAGPKNLDDQGKRFKVLGTTIEHSENNYPAFTMTTLPVVR